MFGEQALPYLINAISGQNIFAMLTGVIVGLVVGAIPGLSGNLWWIFFGNTHASPWDVCLCGLGYRRL